MAERHHVTPSEDWPVYYLDDGGIECKLPDGFGERYRRAQDEWRSVQGILDQIYSETKDRNLRGLG